MTGGSQRAAEGSTALMPVALPQDRLSGVLPTLLCRPAPARGSQMDPIAAHLKPEQSQLQQQPQQKQAL